MQGVFGPNPVPPYPLTDYAQKIRQIAKKIIVITRFDDYYMPQCAKNYGCPEFSGEYS